MCLNFLIVKIGCDNDNTIKVDTSIMVSIMNSVEQQAINSGNNIVSTINNIIVNNNGTFNCKAGFDISQTNVQNTQIVNQFTIQQISQIQTDIVDQVKSELTQQQVEGLLNFLNNITQSGSFNNEEDITNAVKLAVSNAVKQIDINQIWNSVIAQNTITINNNGIIEGDQCAITQSNSLNVRVTNVVNALQANLQSNAFLNQLLTYSNQSQSFSDLTGIFKWIVIGLVVFGALLLIGGLLYLIFSSKSGGQPTKESQEKMALERRIMEERSIRERGVSRKGQMSMETKTLPPLETSTAPPKEGLLDRFERLGNKYADMASKY